MTKQRKIILITAIVIAVLGLGASVFYWQKEVTKNEGVSVIDFSRAETALTEQQENISEEIDKLGHKTYRNEEYGFEIKYPNILTMNESSKYVKEFEKQTKSISLSSKDYLLTFLFKNKDENLIIGRTGISAGDFKNERKWKLGEVLELKVKDLVYENALKEVFFSGENDKYTAEGYLSYVGNRHEDEFIFDKKQIEIAKKTLDFFKFLEDNR